MFQSLDWPNIWLVLERLALTYALTVLIGWDREKETHSAGVRTFPIVGMASCGYLLILGPHPDSGDQSRLLQGLITGIGFVGGGAILKEGATVKGTATAASIWNAGVIGASVAVGRYEVADHSGAAEFVHAASVVASQKLARQQEQTRVADVQLQRRFAQVLRDVVAQTGKSSLNFACAFERGLGMGQDVVLADVLDEIGALQHLGGLVARSAE